MVVLAFAGHAGEEAKKKEVLDKKTVQELDDALVAAMPRKDGKPPDTTKFKALLDANPNILTATTEHGQAVLLLVISFNCPAAVDVAFDHKPELLNQEVLGFPPLVWAACDSNPTVVLTILKHNPDVKIKDKQQRSALHYASWAGAEGNLELYKKLIEELLTRKADINAIDQDGWTPLHFAAQRGKKDIVELLLSKGSDAQIKNKKGETPIDLTQNQDVKAILQKATKK